MEQKEINAYLKKVKRNCPFGFRKRLVGELRGNLLDYLEEHPGSTMEELTEHFGVPETFAYGYILAMDDAKRQGLLRRSRWVIGCLIAALILSLLIITAGEVWLAYNRSRPPRPWKGLEMAEPDRAE